MVGMDKDNGVGQLRRPLIFTLFQCFFRLFQHSLKAAGQLDQLLSLLGWGQRIQIDRIAVIPAQIALIDRFGIVRQRTVIRPGRPHLF